MRSFLRLTALVIFGFCVLPLIAADDVKPPAADKKADAKDAPKKDADAKDTPKKDADAKDTPKKDADAKDAPKKDADAKDTPKKDADAKDKKPEDKKHDEKKDSPWVLAGKMNGELVSVDESKKVVKVKLTTVIQKLDQNEANALAQEQVNLANAVAKRDVNAARQAEVNIANHQRNLYKPEKKTKEVEVPTLEDVKIRVTTPAVVFDDDGKIKKPTAEDLKKLKGDPTLPGYPGDFSSLRSGQLVTLTIMRNKDAKPPAPAKRDPFTGKPEVSDTDLTGDFVPHASMILVVADTGK
jgi:hypothetical protein